MCEAEVLKSPGKVSFSGVLELNYSFNSLTDKGCPRLVAVNTKRKKEDKSQGGVCSFTRKQERQQSTWPVTKSE